MRITMNFKIGDIFEIDTKNVTPNPPYGGTLMTLRVIAFDKFQVFSDKRWSMETKSKYFDKTDLSFKYAAAGYAKDNFK